MYIHEQVSPPDHADCYTNLIYVAYGISHTVTMDTNSAYEGCK